MVYIFENSLMGKTTLHAVQISGGMTKARCPDDSSKKLQRCKGDIIDKRRCCQTETLVHHLLSAAHKAAAAPLSGLSRRQNMPKIMLEIQDVQDYTRRSTMNTLDEQVSHRTNTHEPHQLYY